MNQQIVDISLMMVLPLGVTFISILMSASAETRMAKILGILISLVIVAMDCVFYFAKNSFVAYNCDGALLLTFVSLLLFATICSIRSEDRASKAGFTFMALFMLSGFIGIAYWDRPTLIPLSNSHDISAANAEYQDYINSFDNANHDNLQNSQVAQKSKHTANTKNTSQSNRLQVYLNEADIVINRLEEIVALIDDFEPLPANITESEREKRSSQALSINNKAQTINRKALGLFHPHESSEIHKDLIQASECVRLSAYALYSYSMQDNPEQQYILYSQARDQLGQMRIYLKRFRNGVELLNSQQ